MDTAHTDTENGGPRSYSAVRARYLEQFDIAAEAVRECDLETITRARRTLDELNAAHRSIARIEHYMDALERGEPATAWDELETIWNNDGQIAMRQELQRRRAYATLSKETLECMLKHTKGRRIVDIGAGAGHLARVMAANGRETIAIDAGQSRGYVNRTGTNVLADDGPYWLKTNAKDSDAVLLSWPPSGCGDIDEMAKRTMDALRAGQVLLFIGEASDGCTGSKEFHRAMRSRCVEIDSARVAPLVGWGVHDTLTVLKVERRRVAV